MKSDTQKTVERRIKKFYKKDQLAELTKFFNDNNSATNQEQADKLKEISFPCYTVSGEWKRECISPIRILLVGRKMMYSKRVRKPKEPTMTIHPVYKETDGIEMLFKQVVTNNGLTRDQKLKVLSSIV